jgi:ubiquinone/menaquinone biosynthesis C-methylase UbiE
VSVYGSVFARIYDPFLALAERAGMQEVRRKLLEDAGGRTLEIGAGTGLNLAWYPDSVTTLTLAEPEPPMVTQLRRQASHVEVVQAPAEDLPFADASFDTVVSTLVLCTVTDLAASLRETRRVLAPDGRLLFIEHVRASDERLARWQDRLHGPWRRFAYGCHCNRDTASAIQHNGFEIEAMHEYRWRRMPPIVQPTLVGVARPLR